MKPTIRFAETQEDRLSVFRFRYQVYVQELHLFENVADHERQILTSPHDEEARLLMAEEDGRVVGALCASFGDCASAGDELEETYGLSSFLQIVKPRQILVVTRFMVDAAHRRGTLSWKIMAAIAAFASREGVEVALIDCQPHLVQLYKKMGFLPYRRVYNDPALGIMVPLVLLLSDIEYLRASRSLLASVLSGKPPLDLPHLTSLRGLIPEELPVTVQTGGYEPLFAFLQTTGPDELELFEGLSEEDVRHLLRRSVLIDCARGDVLITRGQTTRTLYVVLSGTLEILRDGQLVGVASTGDVIGELAFILGTTRTTDVVVASLNARVIAFDERTLAELIETDPPLAARSFRNLSRALCRKLIQRNA